MSLLTLDRVSRRYRRGRRQYVALADVSLTIAAGELVSVWGVPRSGRTTLLRVAAGLERPDSGSVLFAAQDLLRHPHVGLPEGIGFAQTDMRGAGGQAIADYVALPLLAGGIAPAEARVRALEQLERVGASPCAWLQARDLDAAELVRVALAQALAPAPRLLLIDDPTRNVDVLERESLLMLLRTIAGDRVAILMTTGEAIGVSGVDRALTISEGELRTEVVSEPAPVIPLRESMVGRGFSARA
jgi:putative ABC transport system ATP-binding protein